MFDSLCALVVCATTGLWAWQILTGKLLDGSWHIWATRQARPRLFWVVIGIQSLVVIFLWNVYWES